MPLHQTATRALLPAVVGASGTVGAVVGGAMATARDVKRVREGEMTKTEAVTDVARESAGTGLATAAGVGVTAAIGATGLVGVLGIVGVAAGTKYLWNKAFGSGPACAKAEA